MRQMSAIASQPRQTDYAELKKRIRSAGLLNRGPWHYTVKLTATFSALILGLALIVLVHNPWFQLLNAAFLAFVFTQMGFIAHEAGHNQIFHGGRWNDAFCIFVLNVLLGGSASWWIGKHNAHHNNPNHVDLDPDINLPLIAFSQEQTVGMRGVQRFIVKYQAFLFFPMLTFEFYALRVISARALLTRRSKHRALEAFAMLLHYPLYFGLVFSQLGVAGGLVFVAVHLGLTGLYVGISFAPNHKGMPVVDDESDLDFVRRQVLTSRNLTKSRIGDYLFGPLATQIEHHLFPSMAGNNMRKAEPVVKSFCRERGIPYHETGFVQAYREILLHLHQVSAPLR